MEQTSLLKEEQYALLEAQLRENYGKIIYSHKTQEKCADILSKKNAILKNIQIILSALITTGLFIRIFKGQEWALILSTILATVQFGLTTFLKEYNLGETIQKHSTSALSILGIREKYFSLLTDLKARSIDISEIQKERDNLQERLSEIFKSSPRTFPKAYELARTALKLNDELTFSDSEIDSFLPKELKKNSQS